MFEYYWYWLFYAVYFHLQVMTSSIYVHRGLGHKHFTFTPIFSHVCRFLLWLDRRSGPQWMETYASRHRKHHVTSDTSEDPHSPFHMTFGEMIKGWKVNDIDVQKYSPEIKTPNDWIERNLYLPHRNIGPWALHFIATVLFGWQGFLFSLLMRVSTANWLPIFLGNYATHKIGFSYPHKEKTSDQSKIIFPIGFVLLGEELHANHHLNPGSVNFAKRWFEIDFGYVYAKIFAKIGLLKFN